MNNKTFLILGGYGSTGLPLARLLLQETSVRVVLAERSIEKAKEAANQLNSVFEGNRVSGIYVDASDRTSLEQAFQNKVDFVIIASSTTSYTKDIVLVAIQNDIDYLDIQYPYKEKIAVLKSLSKEIKKAGRCFITDGGFYPGLPAVLVRYAGLYFDSLEKANVSVVVKLDWKKHPGSTIRKSLVEINNLEIVFKQEQWKKARMFGMRDYISMDFGREFGRQYCVPMFLEEMRSIPEQYPSLLETGSFMGLNWFVTWIVYPLATIVSKISPKGSIKPMSRLMNWGLKRFSKPPYGTLLKIEAHGLKENKAKTLDITVYHKDGYMATAISVMACLLQYLNGSINKHGLHIHGNIVEPKQFMENMKRMGVEVNVQHNDR